MSTVVETQSKSSTPNQNVERDQAQNEQNQGSPGNSSRQKPVCCGCIKFSNSKVIKLEQKRSVSQGMIIVGKRDDAHNNNDSPNNNYQSPNQDITNNGSTKDPVPTIEKAKSPNEHRKLKRPSSSFDYGHFPSSRRLAPETPPTSVDDSQLQKRSSEPSMNQGPSDYNSDSSASSPRPGTSPSSSKEKKSWLWFGEWKKKKHPDHIDPYHKKKKPFVLRMSSELMKWHEIRKRTAEEGSYILVTHNILEQAAHRIPKIKVLPMYIEKPLCSHWGPTKTPRNLDPSFDKQVFGLTISTYPTMRGVKMGEPVCDRFQLQVHHNRVIAAVADGCNWGPRPRQAAKRAARTFIHFLDRQQIRIKHTRDAAEFVMKAFEKAHFNIIQGKESANECGTTTLIGGMLLEIKKEVGPRRKDSDAHSDHSSEEYQNDSNNNNNNNVTSGIHRQASNKNTSWIFICASVGDSKAFHYCPSAGTLVDITSGNRTALLDAADPGGRLGPYPHKSGHNNSSWDPDLSNFQLFWTFCKEDDLIMMMSDGVHDNFDPQTLGLDPNQIGLDTDSWEQAEKQFPDKLDSLKSEFRSQMILDKIIRPLGENASPDTITTALLEHCKVTTQKTRSYMEETDKRQPEDKKEFPGKMDHSTSLILKVGHYHLPAVQPSTNL